MNLLRMRAMRKVRAMQAWHQHGNAAPPPANSFLQVEAASVATGYLLQETGDKLILQHS